METSCCFWTSSLNVNYLRWTVEIEENNSRNLFFLYENCKKKNHWFILHFHLKHLGPHLCNTGAQLFSHYCSIIFFPLIQAYEGFSVLYYFSLNKAPPERFSQQAFDSYAHTPISSLLLSCYPSSLVGALRNILHRSSYTILPS